ncbi:MAG TPA: hypothetical protein VI306_10670 [Pyrinomonadaceae bacterium]
MAEALAREAFLDHVNTKFKLNIEGVDPIEITLNRVSDVIANGAAEGFSIVFKGPGEFILRQNTYKLEHEVLGTFSLLLVPVGKDEQGVDYEAVFNRLKPR